MRDITTAAFWADPERVAGLTLMLVGLANVVVALVILWP